MQIGLLWSNWIEFGDFDQPIIQTYCTKNTKSKNSRLKIVQEYNFIEVWRRKSGLDLCDRLVMSLLLTSPVDFLNLDDNVLKLEKVVIRPPCPHG